MEPTTPLRAIPQVPTYLAISADHEARSAVPAQIGTSTPDASVTSGLQPMPSGSRSQVVQNPTRPATTSSTDDLSSRGTLKSDATVPSTTDGQAADRPISYIAMRPFNYIRSSSRATASPDQSALVDQSHSPPRLPPRQDIEQTSVLADPVVSNHMPDDSEDPSFKHVFLYFLIGVPSMTYLDLYRNGLRARWRITIHRFVSVVLILAFGISNFFLNMYGDSSVASFVELASVLMAIPMYCLEKYREDVPDALDAIFEHDRKDAIIISIWPACQTFFSRTFVLLTMRQVDRLSYYISPTSPFTGLFGTFSLFLYCQGVICAFSYTGSLLTVPLYRSWSRSNVALPFLVMENVLIWAPILGLYLSICGAYSAASGSPLKNVILSNISSRLEEFLPNASLFVICLGLASLIKWLNTRGTDRQAAH